MTKRASRRAPRRRRRTFGRISRPRTTVTIARRPATWLAAAGRDVQGPGVERLGLGGATAEDGDSSLDEQPAGAAGPGLGDGAAAPRVAGAELARDQAEVGLDLMGVAEALGIVEGRDEGGGGDGPDGGHRAQSLDARIVGGE